MRGEVGFPAPHLNSAGGANLSRGERTQAAPSKHWNRFKWGYLRRWRGTSRHYREDSSREGEVNPT